MQKNIVFLPQNSAETGRGRQQLHFMGAIRPFLSFVAGQPFDFPAGTDIAVINLHRFFVFKQSAELTKY